MRACTLLTSILLLFVHFVVTQASTPSLRALQEEEDDVDDMLALQLHAFNAPPGALDDIVADADTYLQILLNVEPEYTSLGPGDAVEADDGNRRELQLTTSSASNGPQQEDGINSEAATKTTRTIRGAASASSTQPPPARRLASFCPTTCAKSSSTSCKQLGCAYCGTRCRRRRAEQAIQDGRGHERSLQTTTFGGKDAAKVAAKINARLLKVCGADPDCVIYVKVVRLTDQDGVPVEEVVT